MLLDKDGERIVTICKATFEWSGAGMDLDLAPKDRRRGLRFADIPWGKPEVGSVAYPADVCVRKPTTDVVVAARAYAPEGKAVPTFDVYAQVGTLRKMLRIFGRRIWEYGGTALTSPSPIDVVDLRYDLAWGGYDDSDEKKIVAHAHNPVGRGFVRDPKTLTHQLAPQIEDPGAPISSYKTNPTPVGMGAIGRAWQPRAKYAGTYDKTWKTLRAPMPPLDFDDRFNQCASTGLISPTPLLGGEEVKLLGLVPGGGTCAFRLPVVRPEIEFEVDEKTVSIVTPHLDTVVIDCLDLGPDAPLTVELAWRASILAPRKLRRARVTVRQKEQR